MSKELNPNFAYVFIVSIVALVAIVVLLQSPSHTYSSNEPSFEPSNIMGQAIAQLYSNPDWYKITGTEEVNGWIYFWNVPVYDHTTKRERILDRGWFYIESIFLEGSNQAWFYLFEDNRIFLNDRNTFDFVAYDDANQEWREFTKLPSKNSYMYMYNDFLTETSLKSFSPNSPKTIIITIDGLRPDTLQSVQTRHLDRLISNSEHTYTARTVCPSTTPLAHASLFTGVDTTQHCFRNNENTIPLVPTFFTLLESNNYLTKLVDGKGGRIDGLYADATHLMVSVDYRLDGKTDVDLMNDVISNFGSLLQNNEFPDLNFILLPNVDAAGHRSGHTSAEYINAVRNTDQAIGILINYLESKGLLSDTNIIIVSDHGMTGNIHHLCRETDMAIPLIYSGPSFGNELFSGGSITDVFWKVLDIYEVDYTLSNTQQQCQYIYDLNDGFSYSNDLTIFTTYSPSYTITKGELKVGDIVLEKGDWFVPFSDENEFINFLDFFGSPGSFEDRNGREQTFYRISGTGSSTFDAKIMIS